MRIVGPASKLAALCLSALLTPAALFAHGGVVAEDDLCIINIGYLKAHFKIFVPAKTGHDDYCEDIPIRGESLFVMEYEHDGLSEAELDFRIIRNVTGKGVFARIEDVEAIEDINAVTVHHSPAAIVPDVYTVLHDFEIDGEYIGIVNARTADANREYLAVFPFMVGDTGPGVWPWILIGLIILQANYWFWNRRRSPAAPVAAVLAAGLLCTGIVSAEPGETTTRSGHFVVRYEPDLNPLAINRIHGWTLYVQYPEGTPVSGAKVKTEGGMPEHDHGFPTDPKVIQSVEDGQYRIEGIRFHMPGYWLIEITVDDGENRDVAFIELQLSR